MDLLSFVTDNVTELLVKVMEFTEARQKILIRNIRCVDDAGFVPQDVPMEEFCVLMDAAIAEHADSRRLVLGGSEHIRFDGRNGFEVYSVADTVALELRKSDREAYLKDQVAKLVENALHQRVAAQLLRQTDCAAV